MAVPWPPKALGKEEGNYGLMAAWASSRSLRRWRGQAAKEAYGWRQDGGAAARVNRDGAMRGLGKPVFVLVKVIYQSIISI